MLLAYAVAQPYLPTAIRALGRYYVASSPALSRIRFPSAAGTGSGRASGGRRKRGVLPAILATVLLFGLFGDGTPTRPRGQLKLLHWDIAERRSHGGYSRMIGHALNRKDEPVLFSFIHNSETVIYASSQDWREMIS